MMRLVFLLLTLTLSASVDHHLNLESLAWDFRFSRTDANSSPLLLPLQRTFTAALEISQEETSFCVDECGLVQRLRMWGTRQDGVAPWFWSRAQSDEEVGICRVRRAMAPLYDESLQVDYEDNGCSWYRAHRDRYWRGCDLAPTSLNAASICNRTDSGTFTNNDMKWLRRLRPLIGTYLKSLGPRFEEQTINYSSHTSLEPSIAPSMDRLLLLIGRLGCLAAQTKSSLNSQHVLIVGAGPVGLLSSIQARLTGSTHVTVWEKRSIRNRLRTNVVVLSETDQALPSHPAALALLENIGLLHMGLRGTFRFPYFLRYIHEKEEAKLTKLNENKKDEAREDRVHHHGEWEWDLHLQIRDLEYALQKVTAILGTRLVPHTEFVRWEHHKSSWVAVGIEMNTTTVLLPVEVMVGADGEWSNVRTQGNFSVQMPRARIKIPRHCMSKKIEETMSDMLKKEKVQTGYVQDFILSKDCEETILDDNDDDDDDEDDDGDDDDDDDGDESDVPETVSFVWTPNVITMQITILVGCGEDQRDGAPDITAIGLVLATLYDDPAGINKEHCQITAIFQPKYGHQLLSKEDGFTFDEAMVNKTAMHLVSDLLGYSPEVVLRHKALKVFAHSFRFISNPIKIFTKGADQLIIGMEGDGARQPFHQEGNGLNIGMFGTVDFADFLIRMRQTNIHVAIAERQELAEAQTTLMTDESLRRAVKEVLFNQGTVEERINFNRWNTPAWLNMHNSWNDYRWHELRSEDRQRWQILGWDHEKWSSLHDQEKGIAQKLEERQTCNNSQQYHGVVSWLLSMFGGWGVKEEQKIENELEEEESNEFVPFCPHALGHQWETLQPQEQQAANILRLSPIERPEMWDICD